jgi:ABC-2 type transport system permease protein
MNPFMGGQQPPPKDKGNIEEFLARLGVVWNSAGIIWDAYNPHPGLAQLPPEVVFMGRGNQNPDTFNPDHRGSAELQELVLLYPGHLDPSPEGSLEFQPLLRSGFTSGMASYFQMVQRNFLGVQLNPNLPHVPDGKDYVLAAHVTGLRQEAEEVTPESQESEEGADSEESVREGDEVAAQEASSAAEAVNLMVIADLDFISEQFFLIRAQGPENLRFDNVTFFLNALDVLVGDESFIDLRNKRVRHRTLEHVEEQTRQFIQERVEKEQEAEQEAETALTDAQARLEQAVQEVRERADLDEQTKQIMARNLQAVETRRFEVMKANIEAEKEAKISRSEESLEEQVRSIQDNIKTFAVVLPPIPVFVVGVLIFLRRQRREREGAAAARRLRNLS